MINKLDREKSKILYRSVLNDNDVEAMRDLARTDLFFILLIICKRKDIDKKWLFQRCREVQENPNGYLDLWAREHYKDLDITTKVPTPYGFKNHGDLKVGDKLFDRSGNTINVTAITDKYYYGDKYKITFDDGVCVIAGAGHLWYIDKKSRKRIKGTNKRINREEKILNTEEISKNSFIFDNRLAIKTNNGIRGTNKKLLLDPYVFGVWLGDGHSANGSITGIDQQVLDEIKAKNYKLSKLQGTCTKNIYGILPILRELKVLNNKHIPSTYKKSSFKQRLELIQGLMDTDGHCNNRGTATFVNTNVNIINDMYEILSSLGIKVRKRRYENKNKGYWQLSFQAYKKLPTFKLKRKLDRCKTGINQKAKRFIISCKKVNDVITSCIQVSSKDGSYLITKAMIPTHNSTIITFAKSIQDILINPDITIGIFSHTRPIAKGFLDQIKRELESNDFLKDLFPEILYKEPKRESPKWSVDGGLIVKRKSNPKESTVDAYGLVDGQPTSKHFSLLVYDDVVTRESVTTTDQINKVTDAWALSLNLGADGGNRRYIGTRYHLNDTYKIIMEREAATPRIYAATDNGKNNGNPVFLTRAKLDVKRREMGPYIYAAQMLQDPTADSAMGFNKEWLMYYDEIKSLNGWNIYILCDPAGAKKKENDYTVILVIALAPDNNYYLVDGIRDRLNLTERTKKIMEFHRKYKPIAVGYEKYGKDSDIEHIEYVMEQKNYRFNIIPLGGSMSKEDRIRKLVPIFEGARFLLPNKLLYIDYEDKVKDLINIFVKTEFSAFPVAVHDDILDAMARITDTKLLAEFPDDDAYIFNNNNTSTAITDYDLY